MLPKSYRLSRKDLLILRKTGRRFQTNYFSVLYSPNEVDHLRLSTEIALKVDKRSSRRNQFRRWIYLIVEKTSLVSKPFDVLIIAKPNVNKISPKSTDFQEAVNRIVDGLLNSVN